MRLTKLFTLVFILSFGGEVQGLGSEKVLKLDGHGDKPKSQMVQFVEQVLGTAYTRIGYRLEYHNLPLARSYLEADLGRLDGLRARVGSSARHYQNLVVVPFVLFDFEVMLLADRKQCGICDLSQLSNVATIRGFKALEDYLSQLDYQPAIARLTSVGQALDMLHKGRVEAVLLPSNAIEEKYLHNINKWLKYPLISHPDYHLLNKKHRTLVPELMMQFKAMEQSGELQALRDKYGVQIPVTPLRVGSITRVELYIPSSVAEAYPLSKWQQIKDIFATVALDVTLEIADTVPEKLQPTQVILGLSYREISSLQFSDIHLNSNLQTGELPLFAVFHSGKIGHDLKVLFEKQYRLFRSQQ